MGYLTRAAGRYAAPVTPRKPPELSIENWVEQQIQQAQRDGLFDDLAGQGRPLRADDGADP
jgi:hypothetical protein